MGRGNDRMGARKVNSGSHRGNFLRCLSKFMDEEREAREKRDRSY